LISTPIGPRFSAAREISQVRLEDDGSPPESADLGLCFVCLLVAAVEVDGDVEARSREFQDDRSSQALSAAGDEGDFRDTGGYSSHDAQRR
jgi:hypothetical protein